MAQFRFCLQQLSMGMTDGEIIQWYKREGDRVVAGEPIVEVDTGKVTSDIESPEGGTVLEIVAGTGEIVDVGGLMCVIEVDG